MHSAKVIAISENASNMLTVGIKNVLDCSGIHSITRAHKTWSSWSQDGVWKAKLSSLLGGISGRALKDVLKLMAMPLYREVNAMRLRLEGKEEDKLQWLTAATSHSKAASSSKSLYSSLIGSFEESKGALVGLSWKSC